MKGASQNIFAWLDERFNLSPLVKYMQHKEVPLHRQSVWYYTGGVALFLFITHVTRTGAIVSD